MLKKMNLMQKIHPFNFPKVARAIRQRQNKPWFRFWNQNKFYFSNNRKFSQATSLTYQFKRFTFKKVLRYRLKFRLKKYYKERRERRKKKRNQRYTFKNSNQKNNPKMPSLYRKRWSSLKKPQFEKTR